MSVVARAADRGPSYVPFLDQALSPTAKSLKAIFVPSSSNSWTDQRIERGERTVLEAVREGQQRGITVGQHAINVASAVIWALPQHVPLPEVLVEDDVERNSAERQRLYDEAQRLLCEEDVPIIPFFVSSFNFAVSERVRGFVPNPMDIFFLEEVDVE